MTITPDEAKRIRPHIERVRELDNALRIQAAKVEALRARAGATLPQIREDGIKSSRVDPSGKRHELLALLADERDKAEQILADNLAATAEAYKALETLHSHRTALIIGSRVLGGESVHETARRARCSVKTVQRTIQDLTDWR